MRLQKRRKTLGEVELYVEGFGDPADPTILLLAGAAMAMDWWDVDLCRRIADGGRQVVRYDHRDTRQSTTGPAGRRRTAQTCWTATAWGSSRPSVGPVHLVGLSMGGGIAQSVALRRPDQLAEVIPGARLLVGEGMGHQVPPPSTWDQVVPALLDHTGPA